MEYRDYYATLGVSRDATEKQVRDGYRKLARRYHPDVNPGDKQAEARFKEINEAYEVLSNPEKRRKYDTLGSDWERISRDEDLRRQYASEGPASGDFSDFFSTFFGGGRRAGPSWDVFFGGEAAERGADAEVEVPITIREAAKGTTRQLDLRIEDICTSCQGRGMIATEARREGQIRVTYDARPCPTCQGSGVVPSRRTVNVRIPPGATSGVRLRLAGQGGKGAAGKGGDLYVRVRILAHPVFTARERDVLCELPIWDFEAALGATVEAPAINGRLRLRIPPGSQSGNVLRARGKGLPGSKGKPAGDLLYTLRIVVPTDLHDEERQVLTTLESVVTRRRPNPREPLLRGAHAD
jgi:DnaJ-class molecular chaperone